jgi:hypothetical protein
VKREAEKVEHRQAAAPVCELGSNPNNMARALVARLKTVIFVDRGMGGGPEVRLKV